MMLRARILTNARAPKWLEFTWEDGTFSGDAGEMVKEYCAAYEGIALMDTPTGPIQETKHDQALWSVLRICRDVFPEVEVLETQGVKPAPARAAGTWY